MKSCNKCGETKPLTEFKPYNKMADGYFNRCLDCDRRLARESMKRLREGDPLYARRNHLKSLYGITIEEYDAMLASQDGKCMICGSSEPGGKGQWHVDHDHETGKVRALLCHGCNTGIGNLGEDPDRLMAAAAYLLSFQDVLGGVF